MLMNPFRQETTRINDIVEIGSKYNHRWQDAKNRMSLIGTKLFLLLQVTKERDLVGAQLLRRNDEISLLYEKIKIMETTLYKGELQYNERLRDVRILKLEIRNLRCKNNILQKETQVIEDLRFGKRIM